MSRMLLLAASVAADFSFLTISDWGWNGDALSANANAMAKAAADLKIGAVFMLGDNMYQRGLDKVSSDNGGCDDTCDEFDHRFNRTWASTFAAPAFANVPFYQIYGNHDHYGNLSAEIAHVQDGLSPLNIKSGGKYFYSQTFPVGQKTLEVVFMDAVVATGNSDKSVDECKLDQAWTCEPEDPDLAEKQWAFVENALATSKAEYLLVACHYPMISPTVHGNTPPLVKRLKPMLEKHGVQAYMHGHDHNLGDILADGVHYINSGAGHMCCYPGNNLAHVPKEWIKFYAIGDGGSDYQPMPLKLLSGFTSWTFTDSSFTISLHAHTGRVLYTTDPIMPRSTTLVEAA